MEIKKREKIRRLAPVLSAVLIVFNIFVWQAYLKPSDNKLHFYMLDVGQGDSLYFRTPKGHDVLIDGGTGKDALSSLGKVMPFYDKSLDLVIITHPHQDHIGGLSSIFERYDVDRVLMTGVDYKSDDYAEFKELVKEKGILITLAGKGQEVKFGEDLKIDILAPENMNGKSIENLNNSSIVALLDFNGFEIMLTGDAEVEEWDTFLANIPNEKIEILKAAHHGSRNGTTEKILEKIRPEVVLISSGKGNRYGHPHKEVIDLLKKFEVNVLRTDEDGTVEIISDGESYKVMYEEKKKRKAEVKSKKN